MCKKQSGIARSLAKMTILPLLLFGIVTTLFSIYWVSQSMEDEVRNELHNLGAVTGETYDQLYPGDYTMYTDENDILFAKGDTILTSDYTVIDSLKSNTNVDYTIFYGDTRVITTVRDKDNNRIVGSKAGSQLVSKVIDQQSTAFYSNVDIFGTSYYCYYTPLYNSDGSCIGMIATLMPSRRAWTLILRSSLPILALSLIAIFFAFLWAHRFSKEFIQVIQTLTTSCEKISNGTLSNTVPQELLSRQDELGTMSRSLVNMQASLRTLIEQDMLTGLYNRRFGQKKLEQMISDHKQTNAHFSIALGDIDFFKRFNDTYGHDCGDLVLREISGVIQQQISGFGYCTRWGGEEFLIVFTRGSYQMHKELSEQLIQRIRDTKINYHEKELCVTMTFGLVDTCGYATCDEMVKEADTLLYYGKANGRNRLITR